MNLKGNRARTGARIVLGLIFAVFGLNGFLHFIPTPPYGGGAGALLGALAASGYMFPLIKGTELVAGLLLLTRRAVPFALVLLAPVVVNIVLFHIFLDPAGLALGFVALALGLYLAWTERAAYAPLFTTATQHERPSRSPAGGHADVPVA